MSNIYIFFACIDSISSLFFYLWDVTSTNVIPLGTVQQVTETPFIWQSSSSMCFSFLQDHWSFLLLSLSSKFFTWDMIFSNSRISDGFFSSFQIYPEVPLSSLITLILSHGLCKQSYCRHFESLMLIPASASLIGLHLMT